MSYIGVQPTAGQYRQLDDISSGFNGSTTTFTTSVSGDNVTATSPQQLLVSLGGVIQQPNTDYTTSTNSITFTTAPGSGLDFFAVLMGDAVNVGTPSDATVSTAKILNDAVTTAKLDSSGIAPIVTSLNGGPLAGSRNRIINGDMRIAQRGTGAVTSSGEFPVDRWVQFFITSGAVSAQYETASTPAGFQAAIKFTATTADATTDATDLWLVQQSIEGFNSADLLFGTANAQDVTISFWVRSSVTGTFCMTLLGCSDGINVDRFYVSEYTISSANTLEKKTITVPGDTGGTWNTNSGRGLVVRFGLTAGANYQQAAGSWGTGSAVGSSNQTQLLETLNATFYITGVQLEAGTVATPFERRSYGQELALCQRYYEVTDQGRSNFYNVAGGSASIWWDFKVTKRATPTITGVVTGSTYVGTSAVYITATNANPQLSSGATAAGIEL